MDERFMRFSKFQRMHSLLPALSPQLAQNKVIIYLLAHQKNITRAHPGTNHEIPRSAAKFTHDYKY